MPEAVCNGVRLHYDLAGTGDPVVLISGTQMPAALFHLGLVPALVSAGHRVVTFENRGVEPSEAPPAPYTVTDMALDTAGLIDSLSLGPCHVVGYSLGGFIAEELCYVRPDAVRDVVLMASAGRASSYLRCYLQAEVDMARTIDPPIATQVVRDSLLLVNPVATLQDDDAMIDLLVAMVGAAPPWTNPGRLGQWSADLAWVNDDERAKRWGHLRQRCLTLAFEHDLAWSPTRAQEAADAMPAGQFMMIPGAAHGGLITHGDTTCAAIVEFLAAS
jgi:pimeloyl-ACP methyl ester carboxylesterase